MLELRRLLPECEDVNNKGCRHGPIPTPTICRMRFVLREPFHSLRRRFFSRSPRAADSKAMAGRQNGPRRGPEVQAWLEARVAFAQRPGRGLTAAQFVGIFRGRAGQTLAPHPASGQLVPDHLAQFALLGRFWGLASLHSESMFGRATARLRHRGSHVNMTTDSRTYQLSRQGEPRGAKGIPGQLEPGRPRHLQCSPSRNGQERCDNRRIM